MRPRAIICLAVVATAVSAGWGAASAEAANTFEGTCKLTGEFRFAEPLGSLPRTTTFTDTAVGTCNGTLNGVHRDDWPVTNSVNGSGTLSCLAAQETSSDTLTFARRFRIHISTEAAGVPPELAGQFRGAISGGGVLEVNLLPFTDQSTLDACQAGTLHTGRYEVVARTVTPIVG